MLLSSGSTPAAALILRLLTPWKKTQTDIGGAHRGANAESETAAIVGKRFERSADVIAHDTWI